MANKDEVDILNSKLKSRNNELEMELQDVDRLAKRLETDKSIVLKTADREMVEAKVCVCIQGFIKNTISCKRALLGKVF